jgi:Fe-S-cluster containining protein
VPRALRWANNTGHENHQIPVFPEEEENLRKHGAHIENGFTTPANGGDRCQFQAGNGLCGLHEHGAKPLTCCLSPFAFNDSGTLVIKNRNRLLKCYQDETVAKTPAYVACKDSLVRIFGEETVFGICEALAAGSGDFTVPIDTDHYKKIQQLRKAHKGTWEPWVPRAQARK